ncbi:MAG: prephenate dehydrogenase [Saprospiraceae bacterium]|jgi:prephenate dehydrogenase|nr:prephenate dehydrogenase [Saprospiraceae bacterium]
MTTTIIGIGLIGGSMAISLKENGFADHIIGVDASRTSLDKALRRRIIDEACELDEGVAKADLVIVATPVDVAMGLLPQILPQIKKQVVMDVGSTKQRLLDLVDTLPNRSRFVATHPMAGTEHSGIEAAIPRLFEGKYTVICEAEKSDAEAVALVERMYQSLGMKIAHLNGQEHDIHTAYVSHISHISSFALALTVLEKERDEQAIFELASSGFASTVRLAKSSPEMWTPIFRQNRDNVLDVLDEHISVLSRFRSLLIKKDFEAIHQLMVEANDIRRILP